MHEQSIVKNILCQIEELRAQRQATRVVGVQLEIGPLSGVEPLLLESAFELLTRDTALEDSQLVLNEVPLLAVCDLCKLKQEIKDFVFHCVACDGNVQVIGGDGIFITEITFASDCEFEQVNEPV